MNIFYIDENYEKCAVEHVDRHVLKMIIEYSQLMSTAHRVLDGEAYYSKTSNGRKIKRWRMDETVYESGLMKASHINHPSSIWCRSNKENYFWLFNLWTCLLEEYTYRYNKNHSCEKYKSYLKNCPKNIPDGNFFPPTPAMDSKYIVTNNSLLSYRNYYVNGKQHLASWKNREKPIWYNSNSFI